MNLYAVTDFRGTITAGGSPVQMPLTTPGQNGYLTFSGTSGNRVSLLFNPGTISGSVILSVLNPDNSTYLVSPLTWSTASGNYFSGALSLAQTGTYTFKADPQGTAAGTATTTLYSVPPDVTGSVTINKRALTVTLTTPGQKARITFSGNANQQATVHVASNTMGSVTVSLLSGTTTLTSTTSSASSFNLASQTLPTTGTYTILIAPTGPNIGSMSVSVTSP